MIFPIPREQTVIFSKKAWSYVDSQEGNGNDLLVKTSLKHSLKLLAVSRSVHPFPSEFVKLRLELVFGGFMQFQNFFGLDFRRPCKSSLQKVFLAFLISRAHIDEWELYKSQDRLSLLSLALLYKRFFLLRRDSSFFQKTTDVKGCSEFLFLERSR